jgi:formimidoylglutamate deiminase
LFNGDVVLRLVAIALSSKSTAMVYNVGMIENSNRKFRFLSALVAGQWHDDVVIEFNSQGIITAISPAQNNQSVNLIPAVALPGMPNVHSHAFQRAFAGLSEFRTCEHDSFWTWRSLMFDFLLRFNPEDIYQIGRQVFGEMLAAGYTWVGEFHYLHNDLGGKHYPKLEELSDAIVRAASDTGIGLCLIPVLYQRGGFRNEPLAEGQKRFLLDVDRFAELIDICCQLEGRQPNYRVGAAIHSLRAVEPKNGLRALELILNGSLASMPLHMHVAEQVPEVEECLRAHQRRSVEFLFDHYPVDRNWCLIHATHLADNELRLIADSQAVVGLCPSTEANLGDGFFRTKEFLDAGGRVSIGTDSNVCLDLREELRLMETTQRLQRRERAVLGTTERSVGLRLYEDCAKGGAAALGIAAGEIKVGNRADFTLIDPQHASIEGATRDRLLDRLVFCNHGSPIFGTVVGGKMHQRPR